LKQLQLIQILRINALRPGYPRFAVAKARSVNPLRLPPNGAKAASGNADTAFRLQGMGNRRVPRFTAR
jgi:hypothetical protein